MTGYSILENEQYDEPYATYSREDLLKVVRKLEKKIEDYNVQKENVENV